MSLTDWDGSVEDPAPTPDGPEDVVDEVEDEPVAETVDESGTDDVEVSDDAPVELIGGKFKTADDLLNAYNEAQRKMHEQAELLASMQPEAEEEEDDDPFNLWGGALDSEDAEKLAVYALESAANAREAFEWVNANPGQFGMEGARLANHLYQVWDSHDPLAARRWVGEQQLQDLRDQISQQQAPLHEAHATQMMNAAIHRADTELPNFREYWPKIMERINRPEVQSLIQKDLDSYRTDPNKSFSLIEAAMSQIALEEWKTNARTTAASDDASEGTTVKKPRTQARSSVSAPVPDEVRNLFPAGTFREG